MSLNDFYATTYKKRVLEVLKNFTDLVYNVFEIFLQVYKKYHRRNWLEQ